MTLTEEELGLVSAARRGEPGALRSLAVCLDVRLGDTDDELDGAVAAWHAVHPSWTGSRVLGTLAAWAAPFGGRRRPARRPTRSRSGARRALTVARSDRRAAA